MATTIESRAPRTATVLTAWALMVPGLAGATEIEPARFHHVRLNVTDPAQTIAFYTRHLGAIEVRYHGDAPALFTERSFILLNQVATPPPHLPHTAISHIGWAGKDGPSDYEWLKSRGVAFETPIGQLGNNYGMYFYGPDKELIEIWTGGQHHRFDHVHLWASDVAATVAWFRDHLGLEGRAGPQPQLRDHDNIMALRMGNVRADNVGIVVFGRPDFESRWWPGGSYTQADAVAEFKPTQGSTINHLGFCYREIAPVLERLRAAGVEIVDGISRRADVGHKSFFVLAPDRLLIEIVEAKPIPEASWE